MAYTEQTWVDGSTQVNAERLNHIEDGITDAHTIAEGAAAAAGAVSGKLNTDAFSHADHTGGITFAYDPETGQVVADIPTSETPQDGKNPVYQDGGNLPVAETPTEPLHAVSLAHLDTRLENFEGGTGGGGNSDVRGLALPSGTGGGQPVTATTADTWTTLPTLGIDDAQTGERWWVDLWLMYRAVAAAGIRVRFKGQTATATNRLADPSFDSGIGGWTSHPNVTLTRNAGGYLVATVGATVASSVWWVSPWRPLTSPGAGEVFGIASELAQSAGTIKTLRQVLEFGDNTAVDGDLSAGVVGSTTSTNITPTATLTRNVWEQAGATNPTTFAAPATATKVRMRVNAISPAQGDVYHTDKVQLEPGATVPAFGSTGGGSSVLTIVGNYEGHPGTGTPAEADRYSTVLYPTVANLEHRALGRGATTDAVLKGGFEVIVGGSGLTGQRIEWEIAQHAANATATKITAGRATFVKMPA